MIEFITKPTPKQSFTFSDVPVDHLFVDEYGQLCQKINSDSYSVITHSDGKLYADHFEGVSSLAYVERIIEGVEGIKF